MGDFAYHQEALRKTRAIERKKIAAGQLEFQMGETENVGSRSMKRDPVAARYNDYRKPVSGREKTSWYENRSYDHSREGPVLDSTWRNISHELNYQDHNMANSNPDAFMLLFQTKTITPSRTPKTPVRTLKKFYK